MLIAIYFYLFIVVYSSYKMYLTIYFRCDTFNLFVNHLLTAQQNEVSKTSSMSLKNIRKKLGFAAVCTDITKRGAVPEKVSIHTGKMKTIKITLKEIQKREKKMGNIYSFLELYAVQRIQ